MCSTDVDTTVAAAAAASGRDSDDDIHDDDDETRCLKSDRLQPGRRTSRS